MTNYVKYILVTDQIIDSHYFQRFKLVRVPISMVEKILYRHFEILIFFPFISNLLFQALIIRQLF